jgi:hypothetical protein
MKPASSGFLETNVYMGTSDTSAVYAAEFEALKGPYERSNWRLTYEQRAPLPASALSSPTTRPPFKGIRIPSPHQGNIYSSRLFVPGMKVARSNSDGYQHKYLACEFGHASMKGCSLALKKLSKSSGGGGRVSEEGNRPASRNGIGTSSKSPSDKA